ncbi:unnamed protein product [Parajaminaea phylloscopi]
MSANRPAHVGSGSPAAESIEAEAFPGDDSQTGSSRRRSRPEINRRVPQQSFAYGAPSDGKTAHRRSISSSGRRSVGADAASPGLESGPSSPVKTASHELPASSDAGFPAPSLSAAARYAALKAKKQRGSISTAKLDLTTASSPAPRRSSRLSTASESQDADNASRVRTIHEIEEDQPVDSDDDELNELGKARKSSVPPPSRPPSHTQPPHDSGSHRPEAMNGMAYNSFFVRAPPLGFSPGPSDESNRLVMPSSLLRGAQRPSHDPLSPGRDRDFDLRREMDSIRSSDAGESRSYASEEAFVRRAADKDRTPPAREPQQSTGPTGWLGKLSPWRHNGNGNGNGETRQGSSHLRETSGDEAERDDRSMSARRKPRTSDDKTYRPPKDFDHDTSDEEEGGAQGSRRRRKSTTKGPSARGGRDDAKIWADKRRKGRRSAGNGHASDDADESIAAEPVGTSAQAMEREPEAAYRDSSASTLRPFSDSATLKAVAFFVLTLAVLSSLATRSDAPQSSSSTGLHLGLPRFFNFAWRQTHGASIPRGPPPSDFEGFVARLLSLEGRVGALSVSSASLQTSHSQLVRQVKDLELGSKEVKTLLRKLEDQGSATQAHFSSRGKALEESGKQLRLQVERLEKQIAARAQELSSSIDTLDARQDDTKKKLESRLEKLHADLQKTEARIQEVASRAQEADDIARRAQVALQPLLEANLPAQMPVKIDKRTGKPTVEPWFYESLKAVLSAPAKVDTDSNAGSVAGSDPQSWTSFKRAHEGALRALIADETSSVLDLQRKSGGKHALLSRSDFLEVLKAEIEGLKGVLEQTFNDNAQEMQSDILAKVRAQQSMYEEAGSWSKKGRPAGGSPPAASRWEGLPSLADLRSSDGKDPRESILTLLDAALEAYSADKINKADFALYSAGGRVIPSMTSPTFTLSAGKKASGRLGWLAGLGLLGGSSGQSPQLRARSPVVALHHDNAPGMCWPFSGQSGQLGVQLARQALVTDITIEHPPSTLTFGDSSSAPREITVSALVERPEDQRKLAEWRSRQAAESQQQSESEDEDEPGVIDVVEAPPSPNHLQLASFTYDALGRPGGLHRSTQTFSVPAEVQALGIPVSILQVRVLSNHGEKAYTCLYRVRVHGEVWKDVV